MARHPLGLVPAVVMGAFAALHPLAAQTTGRGRLAQHLLDDRPGDWRTVRTGGWDIHLRLGSAADADRASVVQLVTEVRRHLGARLGLAAERNGYAQLFFVESREETRRLTGSPLVGFVQSSEPTGVFAYLPGYRHASLLRHELTHLLTFQEWGQTRHGPWLVEGLAVWAAGGCQGHSSDALAAGALARGALVPLTRLAASFRDIPEDVAMPQAGSIVGFFIEREGLSALKQLWRTAPGAAHPLGAAGPSIETAWLDRVRRATAATIDIPRVMKEGC